jgi:alpha-L-fucosidase
MKFLLAAIIFYFTSAAAMAGSPDNDRKTGTDSFPKPSPLQMEWQKVKAFHADYQVNGNWKEMVKGTTIGYKRILRFFKVKTQRIRIVLDDALAPPMISAVAVFNAPVLLVAPEIRRHQSGKITILSPEKYGEVFYTTDGTVPDRNSQKYLGPFVHDGKTVV